MVDTTVKSSAATKTPKATTRRIVLGDEVRRGVEAMKKVEGN
jgi:hypothetical protein